VALYTHLEDCYDHVQWLDGTLVPDAAAGTNVDALAIKDPGDPSLTVEKIAWGGPGHTSPPRLVPVQWPVGYAAVREADGRVAVVDQAGNLVAMTGSTYSFKGSTVVETYALGNAAPPGWVSAFNVCTGTGSVIQKSS
jgi:hypothetical protein